MRAIARILDASANRAREALRVMEDAARFAIDDAGLSRALKEIRHDLRTVLDTLPAGWLEANRDTTGDVGCAITTDAETIRHGLQDVAAAAGKRASEALRSIEECLKTFDASAAARIESLRYRCYEIESLLNERLATGQVRQWKLCLLLTQSLCRHPWQEVLTAAIEGGVDCVQVREKSLAGGELAAHVRAVIHIARPRGVSVIVNDRVDVALAAGADGVHLGTDDLALIDARRLAGRTLILGASTHNLNEARAAVEAGVDCCGVGAMFISDLKPNRVPSGIEYLKAFLVAFPHIPHLAIGGITPQRAISLAEAGAKGCAVSSAICGADDPAAVARNFRVALNPVRQGV